ncbi:MAG: SDR family NAD(P)-dependent oxidoreductase [Mycobacterium kyogaense]|uniref:SDR family NAD(P)-dependent oxidoreductase n=1 Tax=Mycobacterium kyogaense TaxID=2212479 RepID=UPI002FFAF6AA
MSRAGRINLSTSVALVTGAAGGIGAAVCEELHHRGASVVLVDLEQDRVDAVARRLGAERTLAIGTDVTDADAMLAAVSAARDAFGALHVAIANAGIASGPRAFTIAGAPDGVFERVIGVNLQGVWNTVRASVPAVIDTGGHILLTSSTYAYINGLANAPYAASKAAVESLGRSLRTELAAYGASAGVLYPGWIATPIADVAFGGDDLATELVHRATPAPLRKPIPPQRVARAVADGIERRSPRIQVPRRWIPVAALRGLVNPLVDLRMERDPGIAARVRRLDHR